MCSRAWRAQRQAALRARGPDPPQGAGLRTGAAGSARVPAPELLADERFVLRDFVVAERWRGIGWLLLVALFTVWVTGALNKDNPLMP